MHHLLRRSRKHSPLPCPAAQGSPAHHVRRLCCEGEAAKEGVPHVPSAISVARGSEFCRNKSVRRDACSCKDCPKNLILNSCECAMIPNAPLKSWSSVDQRMLSLCANIQSSEMVRFSAAHLVLNSIWLFRCYFSFIPSPQSILSVGLKWLWGYSSDAHLFEISTSIQTYQFKGSILPFSHSRYVWGRVFNDPLGFELWELFRFGRLSTRVKHPWCSVVYTNVYAMKPAQMPNHAIVRRPQRVLIFFSGKLFSNVQRCIALINSTTIFFSDDYIVHMIRHVNCKICHVEEF